MKIIVLPNEIDVTSTYHRVREDGNKHTTVTILSPEVIIEIGSHRITARALREILREHKSEVHSLDNKRRRKTRD